MIRPVYDFMIRTVMDDSRSVLLEWLAFLVATNLFSFGIGAVLALAGFDVVALIAEMTWFHYLPLATGLLFGGFWLWTLVNRTTKPATDQSA